MTTVLTTNRTDTVEERDRHWFRCWPYDRRSLATFVTAFLVITAVWTLVGWAVVTWYEPSVVGEAEIELSQTLEEARTDMRNDLATLGSIPSNTPVKLGLMAALALVLPLTFKRWHDWAFLFGALLLEVSVYGLSSYLVGRPRPPVERLAEAPTESWPSGHVAAALTFYVGLAIIVSWHTENRLARIAARLGAGFIVITMCVSRLYLGMHFVSDVIGGLLLGTVSLVVTLWVLRSSLARKADTASWPPNTNRLNLAGSSDRSSLFVAS